MNTPPVIKEEPPQVIAHDSQVQAKTVGSKPGNFHCSRPERHRVNPLEGRTEARETVCLMATAPLRYIREITTEFLRDEAYDS